MTARPRIILATAGSLGDIHPFIAVGLALQGLGLRAEIATAPDFRAKIETAGLGFHSVGPSLTEIERHLGMSSREITEAVARSNPFLIERIMLPHLERGVRELTAAAEGASVLVGSSFAAGAGMTAERLGVPFVSVSLQPTTVFSAYDPPLLPSAPWLRPATSGPQLAANRMTIRLARHATARWTPRINALRSRHGLGPTRDNLLFDAGRSANLWLGLYSPILSARQPDAPAHLEIAGYAPYDSDDGQPPRLPDALEAFLVAGPAPIVFTLGSAAIHLADDFYVEGLKAARSLGRRAVLLVGETGDVSVSDGPDSVALAYAPFSLLFPRAAAVVHQGGVGTTQQVMRAGRPQLVVPHLGDQFDNAARVVRLGLGETMTRKAYNADAVAAHLGRLVVSDPIRAAADGIGQIVAAEDGAARAAELIAALAGGNR